MKRYQKFYERKKKEKTLNELENRVYSLIPRKFNW